MDPTYEPAEKVIVSDSDSDSSSNIVEDSVPTPTRSKKAAAKSIATPTVTSSKKAAKPKKKVHIVNKQKA